MRAANICFPKLDLANSPAASKMFMLLNTYSFEPWRPLCAPGCIQPHFLWIGPSGGAHSAVARARSMTALRVRTEGIYVLTLCSGATTTGFPYATDIDAAQLRFPCTPKRSCGRLCGPGKWGVTESRHAANMLIHQAFPLVLFASYPQSYPHKLFHRVISLPALTRRVIASERDHRCLSIWMAPRRQGLRLISCLRW